MIPADACDPEGAQTWTDAVASLSRARVLCIGDIMLDRFTRGRVDRISPEAPVPVLKAGASSTMLGGVGNVARNIASLGARAALCAITGDDQEGRELLALTQNDLAITSRLVIDPTRPTTLKSRYVSGGNHMLRVDIDPEGHVDAVAQAALGVAFEETLGLVDAVVMSDYGKGTLERTFSARLIARAGLRNIPIVIDPHGPDYERYRGATVVTPNIKELSEAVGRDIKGDEDIVAAANELILRFSFSAVLVTRADEGMTLVRSNKAPQHLRTEVLEVYDVAGAGDTVVAVLAAALGAGLTLDAGAVLANVAAGMVVRKMGTATASQHELRALVGQKLDGRAGKLTSFEQCVALVELWRQDGYRIGFTNGCFDLLHAGHIELLRRSRALVDRLVLGLNSDRSVRDLKGPKRPINSQEARARVLSAIEYVDAIICFDETTPDNLIQALKPDLLMKGSDYTVDKVAGAERVRTWGGEVRLIDLVQGYSSTTLVERLSSC